MIRKAAQSDIDDILSLLVQVDMVHHNGRPDLFKGPATKYTSGELEALLNDESRPVFVYDDGSGSIKGYVFCVIQQHIDDNILTDIKTLYIDDLCIDEKHRGEHIGSALYRYALEYAKSIGCYNLTLNVWACNESAKAFYEKCGLKPQKYGMETLL